MILMGDTSNLETRYTRYMIKKLFIYIVLVTALLANMDWKPIHYQWWHNGEWPKWALGNFQQWSFARTIVANLLCPPCGALAESYYFVLLDVEAGTEERNAVLQKEPEGLYMYWGQGEGREWRPVSWISWYLYWLPQTVLWWWLYAGDLFKGRVPWWLKRKNVNVQKQ